MNAGTSAGKTSRPAGYTSGRGETPGKGVTLNKSSNTIIGPCYNCGKNGHLQ
jgi:hypothetical protein